MAHRELRQALVAELEHVEVLLSSVVGKLANLATTPAEIARVAKEIRWFVKVGRLRLIVLPRRWAHARWPAETSGLDQEVAALPLFHRVTFLARRAADVRPRWEIERRDQPVSVAFADGQLLARRRSREV